MRGAFNEVVQREMRKIEVCIFVALQVFDECKVASWKPSVVLIS